MKKYFYLAAVSAMMLTACSSENDVVQPTPAQPTNPVAVQQQAVAFDTYLSGTTASTRAGDPTGVMTTEKLKTLNKGFGVFAMYTGTADYASSTFTPNFMFNEQIHWTNDNGWTYSPLKYWPNETAKNAPADLDTDSQTDPAKGTKLDQLSFFAYAPYVNPSTSGNLDNTAATAALVYPATERGITGISANSVAGDPLVEWKAYFEESTTSTKPNEILDNNVDLLWGVAPAGMDYTAVNGVLKDTDFGFPLKDLWKPNKDQKVKFLFQHALSRIGLSVVSAIDQIAAGDDGGKFDNSQTRVLIEEVSVWGDFGIQGILNLKNESKNVANWSDIVKASNDATKPILKVNTTNGYLAPDLRYANTSFASLEEGVLPSEKNLLAGGPDPSKKVAEATPAFEYGKVLYVLSGSDYVIANTTASEKEDAYTKTGDIYTQTFATDGNTKAPLNGKSAQLYKVSASTAVANGTTLADGTTYYVKTGSAGNWVYTKQVGDGVATADADNKFYTDFAATELSGDAYASGEYYTALMPRYFMVVPTALTPVDTKTSVSVKIKYYVITEDTKLSTGVSSVANEITKTASFQFESGKSYNLKLILGLTSVKLDAVVGDWQVGDDAEVYLPQNVQP